MPTLLVGRYEKTDGSEDPSVKRTKVAAFDLDGTLVKVASQRKFSDEPIDWMWWNPRVPEVLRKYYEDGYRVVILSNQGGITLRPDPKIKQPKTPKRLPSWKKKLEAILTQLDIPTSVYAATDKDIFRKPRLGMWHEMCDDYDLPEEDVDKKASFFVGDAGGRVAVPVSKDVLTALPKDFACSDRDLASNAEIKYLTPEECFLETPPPERKFTRGLDVGPFGTYDAYTYEPEFIEELAADKKKTRIILLCGSPGAGKSSLYWKYLKDKGYFRVNQDVQKSRENCIRRAREHLQARRSVCVDNTNADIETRSHWITLAKKEHVPIHCVWFTLNIPLAEHNNAVRALSGSKTLNPEGRELLPKMAFASFTKKFQEPTKKEGFFAVYKHDFYYRGSKEDYPIWAKAWM